MPFGLNYVNAEGAPPRREAPRGAEIVGNRPCPRDPAAPRPQCQPPSLHVDGCSLEEEAGLPGAHGTTSPVPGLQSKWLSHLPSCSSAFSSLGGGLGAGPLTDSFL